MLLLIDNYWSNDKRSKKKILLYFLTGCAAIKKKMDGRINGKEREEIEGNVPK